MPVIDLINRSGLDGRSVITGPAQLKRFRSRGSKGLGPRFGLTNIYDEYEIGVDATGTAAGTYVVAIKPLSQNGLRAAHRGIGRVVLATRVDGIAAPTTAITQLAVRKPSSSESLLVLPSHVAAAGDQLWVLIELTEASPVRYRLEVDFTAAL